MKQLIVILVTLTTTILAQGAFADGRHSRGYSSYYGGGFGYRGGYSRHYNSNYLSFSFGNRSRHRDYNNAGVFVGGLVLGSVLSNAWNRPPVYETNYYSVPYRSPVVTTRREVTVINSPVVIQSTAPRVSGRRLLRDLQGRCYEITVQDGTEFRTELDPEFCAF